MNDTIETGKKLELLCNKLLSAAWMERNLENDFSKWRYPPFTNQQGVYSLWESNQDYQNGKNPIHIGEGILGNKIWSLYNEWSHWKYIQFLDDAELKSDNFRKLFERYCIHI